MLCHHPGALRPLPSSEPQLRTAVAPSINPSDWRVPSARGLRAPRDTTDRARRQARVAAPPAPSVRAREDRRVAARLQSAGSGATASMGDIPDRFDRRIAVRMRAESQVLAKRWLERLDDILTVDRDRIFPTKDLLDHVPQLIEEIAAY